MLAPNHDVQTPHEIQLRPLAYTIKEAAALSKLSVASIYNVLNSGSLRAKKFGGKTLILHDDLAHWLNEMLPDFVPNPNAKRS